MDPIRNSNRVSLEQMTETLPGVVNYLKSKKKRETFREYLRTIQATQYLECYELIHGFSFSVDENERKRRYVLLSVYILASTCSSLTNTTRTHTHRAQEIHSKFVVGPKENDVGLDTKFKAQLTKDIAAPDNATFVGLHRHVLAVLDKELSHFQNTHDSVVSEFVPSPAGM